MAAVSRNLPSIVGHRPNPSTAAQRSASLDSGRFHRRAFPAASFESRGFAAAPVLRRVRLAAGRRFQVLVAFSASQNSANDEVEGQNGTNELGRKAEESLEAWKQMLESFKEEATKMRGVSQEAYEIYSQKAMIILKEASVNMKIQSEQAREDLSNLADVITQEGKEYLSTAAKNSPEPVKDIVETFASSPDELKDASDVRDFYLGIPYGALLAAGGFLHFMVTGSLSGIRFGVILGGALLALSVLSLRAWRSGQGSPLFLKGQAAISGILFIREWNLIFKKLSFSSLWATLISGGMLAFYLYRIFIDWQNDGQRLKKSP